jgi:hypothetical protein
MAGNGGLGQFEDLAEFPDGQSAVTMVGLRLEEAKHAQADRVRQRAEQLDEVTGVTGFRSCLWQ